jgi:hypothetical protein
MSAEIKYNATELVPGIHARCLAFVRSYGFNFNALDLFWHTVRSANRAAMGNSSDSGRACIFLLMGSQLI